LIIYLDEENAYRSWVLHHRDGFVLDWLRKPTKRLPVLHRTACADVRTSKSKKTTHWTTGRHLKACSLSLDELVTWATLESGREPSYCADCEPQKELPHSDAEDGHITKLGGEILDYVLEAAVIHLDNKDSGYDLTVGKVAEYLDKTRRQVAAAFLRLVRDGFLKLDRDVLAESDLRAKLLVFPTSKALRTLPAFEKLSAEEIQRELSALTGEAE
jgi:hypothetical protein